MLKLPTRNPAGLARLLRSMRENMGSASSQPQPGSILPVVLDGDARGTALFTPQGVLLVKTSEAQALVSSLLPGADAAKVEDALELLRHLPPEVRAERLRTLQGTWWPSDEVVAVEGPNTLVSRTFQRGEQVLRVIPSNLGAEPVLGALDEITRGWKG